MITKFWENSVKLVFFRFFLCPKAKKGFRRLAGVDYAESAIELARTIAAARQVVIDYQVRFFVRFLFVGFLDERLCNGTTI